MGMRESFPGLEAGGTKPRRRATLIQVRQVVGLTPRAVASRRATSLLPEWSKWL
jgi:hypothetical protein